MTKRTILYFKAQKSGYGFRFCNYKRKVNYKRWKAAKNADLFDPKKPSFAIMIPKKAIYINQ